MTERPAPTIAFCTSHFSFCICLLISGCQSAAPADAGPELRIGWAKNMLTIGAPAPGLPGGEIPVLYLEAYCRPGSTDRDWHDTVIGHRTELIETDAGGAGGRWLQLHDTLSDGVEVVHVITAGRGVVDFLITAHNPTDKPSDAHWAQPCIRVGAFAGTGEKQTDDTPGKYAYIARCFVYQDGARRFMPTPGWATAARYTPGQVWAAPGVNRDDVNPRPLHPRSPDNGLIGCVSGDGTLIIAVAFEPYQELFQGVIRCVHSDFRVGGLRPGETKTIRGKLYVVPNDPDALLARYRRDFPEHFE